jgi:predicted transcriptional regulator
VSVRIGKAVEYIVCVSDGLASKIQERKLTGARLITPEDWRFGTLV